MSRRMKRPWLAPLAPLYAAAAALRNRRFDRGSAAIRRLARPVVSIGNLSAGGSGKTPLVIALAQALSARGLHVDVLSRGYGRQSSLPARVDPNGSALDFGDEPLLIARTAQVPVYVARQRYDAGLLAEAEAAAPLSGAAAHLLDDGFQHRQLVRAVDIVLLSRADFQDTLLPAGNLREPLRAAARAHILAVPAGDSTLEEALGAHGLQQPIWRLRRVMEVPAVSGPVVAFCGIARPEQFFAELEAAGHVLAARIAFRDHHFYSRADLDRLLARARAASAAALLTTEKDAVRLSALLASAPPPMAVLTVPLRMEIENAPAAVDGLLARIGVLS